MTIPLYGFLEGDTLGVLLLVQDETTMNDLADRMRASADIRIAHDKDLTVVYGERELGPLITVRQAGMKALDRVDVRLRRP